MAMTQDDIKKYYEIEWPKLFGKTASAVLEHPYFRQIGPLTTEPIHEAFLRDNHVKVDGGRVLDVGCGWGRWTYFYSTKFRPVSYVGVDFVPASVEALRTHAVLLWDDAVQEKDVEQSRKDSLLEEAERFYARALTIDPKDPETVSLRALNFRDRGEPVKRFALQAEALALFEGRNDRARHFVARSRAARAVGELDTATAFAERARGENSRHPLALQESCIIGIMRCLAMIARPGGLRPGEDANVLGFLAGTPKFALGSVCSHLHELSLWRARLYLAPWSGRSVALARTDIDRVLAARPDDADALALRARAEAE